MKSTDLHSVQYGSQSILFALEYCPRKTLAIEVHPDRSVIVKAPPDATLPAIEAKVSRRAAWIVKQQRQFDRYATPLPPPDSVSGEGYRYLGRQYRLKLIESDIDRVRLWQGRLEIHTPELQNNQWVKKKIDNWYRDRATKIFGERYQDCTQLVAPYDIEHNRGFELRTMKKRWGSCTPSGKIFLNPQLVSAPKDCIDYVIVHELCHIRIHNHSPNFYKLLETILPDWKSRKDLLNNQVEVRDV